MAAVSAPPPRVQTNQAPLGLMSQNTSGGVSQSNHGHEAKEDPFFGSKWFEQLFVCFVKSSLCSYLKQM